jgi:hypothetical protein
MMQGYAKWVLGVGLLSVFGGMAIADGTPARAACSRTSETTITAEGAVYDAPGQARIGAVSPSRKYVAGTVLHHNGERWMLLTGAGGAHIGWIMASSVRRTHFDISCSLDDLYERPR